MMPINDMGERPAVKVMVNAGRKWLAEDQTRDPKFSTLNGNLAAIFTDNNDADDLNFLMVEAAENAGFTAPGSEVNAAIIIVMCEKEGHPLPLPNNASENEQ